MLSKQIRYGVRAIFDIAYHSGGGETQAKDISRRQGIPKIYIRQIFQKLKKAGILGSTRGPSGGFFLNKRPEEISIGDIIKVIEGNIKMVNCLNNKGSKKLCEKSGKCVTQIIWSEAGKKLNEYFSSITIKDLCDMAKKVGIEIEVDEKSVSPSDALFDSISLSGNEDLIPNEKSVSPEDILLEKDLNDQMKKMLSTLTPREEKILRLRFGIGEEGECTLEEILRQFGLSPELIKKIEAEALERLKDPNRYKKIKDYSEE